MADIQRPIEPFQLTQEFGVNKANYARFGLDGHNGWDFKTKFPDTPDGHRAILASFPSTLYVVGNEGNDGYGKYFDVIVQLKKTWKLTYAHCHSIRDFHTVAESEQMAISNNTGNSTGAHLHLTVKEGTLKDGKFISNNPNNGFKGAVNPQLFFDELREFKQAQAGGTPPMAGLSDRDYRNLYYSELGVNGIVKLGQFFGDMPPEGWGDDEAKLKTYVTKVSDKVQLLKQQYDICGETKQALERSNKTLRDEIVVKDEAYNKLATQNQNYATKVLDLSGQITELNLLLDAKNEELEKKGKSIWDIFPGSKTKIAVAIAAIATIAQVVDSFLPIWGVNFRIMDSQAYVQLMGVAATLGVWGVGAKLDRNNIETKNEIKKLQ
jgi:hypothetical protein